MTWRRVRAKNGRAIPVLFSAADIIGDAGRSEGKVFVAQDISERKEAEE